MIFSSADDVVVFVQTFTLGIHFSAFAEGFFLPFL